MQRRPGAGMQKSVEKENIARKTHGLPGVVVLLLGAKTLLGAPGLTTRSKDATRGSWPYY